MVVFFLDGSTLVDHPFVLFVANATVCTTSQIRSYEHLAVQKFSRSLCMYKVKFC